MPATFTLRLPPAEAGGLEASTGQAAHGMHAAGVALAETGYGAAADRARTQAAGFDLHLTRPVALHELQKALAQGRPVAG